MRFRKQMCALVVALFTLQTLQFTARADEGMWPFNNIPRAEIKRKYGFDVTDEWLKRVQLAFLLCFAVAWTVEARGAGPADELFRLLPPDSAASPDSSLGSLEPEQGHGP